MRDRHSNVCKACDNLRRQRTKGPTVYTPETRAKNNAHARKSLFKKRYQGALTPEMYDAAVHRLQHCCQICSTPTTRLCVDFREGVVKGLICQRCKGQVKRWVGVDLEALALTTTDARLHRFIAYLKNPPGIEEPRVLEA